MFGKVFTPEDGEDDYALRFTREDVTVEFGLTSENLRRLRDAADRELQGGEEA